MPPYSCVPGFKQGTVETDLKESNGRRLSIATAPNCHQISSLIARKVLSTSLYLILSRTSLVSRNRAKTMGLQGFNSTYFGSSVRMIIRL